MARVSSTCEIIESAEEFDSRLKPGIFSFPNSEDKYSIEDDINRLFESFNIRNSSRASGLSHDAERHSLRKNASKKPMRGGSSPSTGIGIAESVSLKQAFRGLCISQASEMAAMKRLSKPPSIPGHSEAGNIKRLYRTVVVETNGSGSRLSLKGGQSNMVEISLVLETINSNSSDNVECNSSTGAAVETSPLSYETAAEELKEEVSLTPTGENILYEDTVDVEGPTRSIIPDNETKGKLHPPASSLSTEKVKKATITSSRLLRPVFSNKSFIKKKMKWDSPASGSSSPCIERADHDVGPSTDYVESNCILDKERREDANSSCRNNQNSKVSSCITDTGCDKPCFISRSKDKGDFSQSSKSSIGEYSSSTSISERSNLSSSSRSGSRPHMSRDLRWKAIKSVEKQHGIINLRHFKLLKRLGCGDIGTVYLAELIGTNCLFALKVMENEFLKTRKKMQRAQTEKEIMEMLDHPFLPTLYCHFSTDKLSCLVMECCPGGDLHVLRQKQPARSFSEQAARFYVAEVLLVLEYLHMLGVVYRDLKPENILVREDGHIMLSDFDLSLRCAVNPVLLASSPPENTEVPKKVSSPCTESSCVDPFCLHPSWQVPCFTPRLLSVATRSRKIKHECLGPQVNPLPQLVVEPTSARSNSFVGTHEYLAPEIIKGDGHGSSVDWWTFGIFLFELLYGKTPFKGPSNEETLSNVVSRSLKFPSSPVVSFHARDLIRGLLIKEPENRLGSSKGAAEIKQHAFFEGLNWALIRCATPPELPRAYDIGLISTTLSQKDEPTEFEVF